LRARDFSTASIRSLLAPEAWPAAWPAAIRVLQFVAIAVCFAIGYRIHVLFGSRFPLLYLVAALGLWPLLARAQAYPGHWMLPGFLSSVLYLSSALVLYFHDFSIPKQHQANLVAIFLFIAIWRNDARVFCALPLVLLFDMQNGARLGALVVVGEGLLALSRRQMPVGVVPAALTVVVGLAVTRTAYYPFGGNLYSLSDALGILLAPTVVAAALAALVIVWAVVDRARDEESAIARDRLFVYAASVVAMAGIQIQSWGLFFDAFQLSTLFRSVAVAPAMAVFFVTAALLLTGHRDATSTLQRRSSIAALAALLLLMTTAAGRTISWPQLSEGVRASFSRYVPAAWARNAPPMTLNDNVVYFDADNIMTSAIMQYSMIKILLLSRNAEFSRETLTVLPFQRRAR
jgi:hypothetical protein